MAGKIKFDINDSSKSLTKLVILLAWPVFIEQILTTLVSYADTAMVGALGKNATAAVSISNTPMFLLNAVILALGVGITTMVAQATGQGDKELVRKLERHAVLVLIVVGLPLAILAAILYRAIPLWMGADEAILDDAAMYNLIVAAGRFPMMISMILNSVFRGYGDTKTPLYANTSMNIINVIGNYFLINPTRIITIFGITMTMPGAGMSIAGAALATAISMCAAGIFTIIIAFTRDNGYRISVHESYRPDKKLMRQIINISVPAMLERITISSAAIFCTSSIATLGTTALAANSLFLTAESMSFMPAFSFQTAATTLVGQCLGARQPDRAEKFVTATIRIAVIVMGCTTVLLYAFAPFLLSIFTPDEEVIDLGARCLRVTALIQAPQAVAWIYIGALRGAGDTKVIFIITAITTWLIRTLWTILLIRVFHLGLVEIQYAICTEIIVRMVLMLIRYKKGGWKTRIAI